MCLKSYFFEVQHEIRVFFGTLPSIVLLKGCTWRGRGGWMEYRRSAVMYVPLRGCTWWGRGWWMEYRRSAVMSVPLKSVCTWWGRGWWMEYRRSAVMPDPPVWAGGAGPPRPLGPSQYHCLKISTFVTFVWGDLHNESSNMFCSRTCKKLPKTLFHQLSLSLLYSVLYVHTVNT